MNINLLREGDKITLKNGATYELCEAWKANDIYQFLVKVGEKDVIISYDIQGNSIDNSSLNIVAYELVERPEDKQIFYVPNFECKLLPVLKVNGEERLIFSLNELDGLEIKEPQVLKASYKYCIVANLYKKYNRTTTIIKTQTIICSSKEECEEKLKEIEGMFNLKSDVETEEDVVKDFSLHLEGDKVKMETKNA